MKIPKTFTPLENKDPKMNGFLTGFSLIELILVIAIVAILAAAMIPAITSARQRARAVSLLQLADTLRVACTMFHSDTGSEGSRGQKQSWLIKFFSYSILLSVGCNKSLFILLKNTDSLRD